MTDYEKYRRLLKETITPRYIWKKFPSCGGVPEGRGGCEILRGDDIKKHVKDCGEIILLAATLGFEIDALIRQTSAQTMAGAVVLDELASEEIERVLDEAELEIRAKYCKVTTRFSPGYGDFSLDVQQELLAALDARKKIGLYANDSNLLIPRKSVTAVIGGFLH